ncbi:MAG: hypothetical protein GC178_15910 [Flavobacteriales bacterium]|nr:hypothetical protein [Flavobacteriales bacterium]
MTVTIVFLMACRESESNSGKLDSEDEVLKQQNEPLPIDTITENRYAYIKSFELVGSDIYIQADYVDYLSGQEAMEAERRDQAYFIDGNDTITNITDGYYISNVNPKLRTFILGSNLSVEYIIDDNGTQRLPESKPLDVNRIESYIHAETLLFLHVSNGTITRIDEQFIP